MGREPTQSRALRIAMRVIRGFTLIELLVVIAIIGLLSSVVLASLNTARTKAQDAKVQTDLRQVNLALALYYDVNNSYPVNPQPGSGVVLQTALQGLVSAGYISALPTSPYTEYQYYYYNYGPGSGMGAMVVGNLKAAPANTNGYAGTCRPFAANTNWCSTSSNNYYCLCNAF